MQKDSAQAKISLKVVGGGATFLTHSVQSKKHRLGFPYVFLCLIFLAVLHFTALQFCAAFSFLEF